MTAVIVIL